MRGVVERLLTLARVDAGASAPASPVDLTSLVEQVVAELRPLASARALRVEFETSPVTVWGDPDSLVDAVTNVITNAIQYNVDGGAIRIRLESAADKATLTVADTGVGISPADLSRVFEPFFRADPSRRRDRGGAGLGLAVTHAIVQQHGGETRCESTPGEGTRVSISLRTAPGTVRATPTSETSPPTYAESRR